MARWTKKSLLHFLQRQIDDQSKAVEVALKEANRRLESMNEFRQQLNDQTKTFIPRNEADARFDALSARISDLKAANDQSLGKDRGASTRRAEIIMWVAIVGAIVAIASQFIKF